MLGERRLAPEYVMVQKNRCILDYHVCLGEFVLEPIPEKHVSRKIKPILLIVD